jgi:uncharacterized protein involved in exopolysaccharide biosynthesis/Mrp family chromosome partitioning ATPase
MNLRDILETLFRHKWLVVSLFLFGVIGSTAYILLLPREYTSNAKIYVNKGEVNPVGILTGMPTASEIYTEVEILRSRGFAEKVVDYVGPAKILYVPEKADSTISALVSEAEVLEKLNLTSVTGMAKGRRAVYDPVAYKEEAIKVFSETLETELVPRSSIINLTYHAPTPHLAREILTGVVDLYLEKHIDIHTSAVSLEFLSRETERLEEELTSTEDELRYFQERFNIVSLPEQQTLLLDRISELESAIQETETQITSSEAAVEKMRASIDMLGMLQEEEIRLASLQARLASLERRLQTERASLRRMRDSEQKNNMLEKRLSVLEQKYNRYLESLEQARIAQTLENQNISNVSVMQEPTLVLKPVSQERKKKVGLGLFMGILGGVGFAFVLDNVSNKIKSKEELAHSLGLNHVTAIPDINPREIIRLLKKRGRKPLKELSLPPEHLSKNVSIWLYLNKEVRNCFEKIRNELYKTAGTHNEHPPSEVPYVLAVTSTYRNEGTTSVATGISYALSLANGDKVLLVDSNNHHPDQENVIGANRPAGLYTLAVQNVKQNAERDENPEVFPNIGMNDYLGSMTGPDKISKLLPAINRLKYKFIVIDLPSISEGVASVRSAALADGVLLVVESEKVRREVLYYVKEQLEDAGARIVGSVLNKRRMYIPEFFYKRI